MPSSSKDALRARLLAIFREEAADHLRVIGAEMATLERGALEPVDLRAVLDRLFRVAHTLKGAARSLSVRTVEQLCHEMEDVCSAGRGRESLEPGELVALRDLARELAEATERAIAAPAAMAPAPEPSAPPPEAAAPSFVRLESGQLRRLGVKAEELTAPRLAARARLDQAREIIAGLGALRVENRIAEGSPLARGLRDIEQSVRRLLSGLAEDSRLLNATTEDLAHELRQTRMMRVGEMLAVFPDMIADLAAEVGKSIRWRSTGTDLLIDRDIAEMMKDPLIQMVRNAIDHGIEPAEERRRAGKPPQGTISLTVEPAEGGRVAIELRDDGGGVDVPALREAAVRNRIASREQVASLTDMAVIEMAFEPSVSTRSVISAVSGRGLGLAIVRERMDRIGGAVFISSEQGQGTTLHMEVPAALANFHGIGAWAGGRLVIWPRTAVERTIALSEAACETALANGMLAFDDTILPIAELGQILGRGTAPPAARDNAIRTVLVIRHGQRRGAVVVEEATGQCEVIVKELRPPLLRVRYALAAGLLGNGQLGLILRTADILDALHARSHRSSTPAKPPVRRRAPRLLVVDDSITTRAMEVGLLEAAGYEVTAASDGLQAWSALQAGDFDAVISDVDMPNMDGFELTAKVRSDPRFVQLPIVLVTALEDREDHERGLRLGANAYMMKSAFDQSMLIDLVRRVL
ncbi:response regulator [Ancylobacter sp. G4_0304]|uniref:hybrid sensor histidine kinase/response regulator n=1 Tax=Ancylobacter sp. G4_0304 TaxID=3114289 RepID=UPI0039C6378B